MLVIAISVTGGVGMGLGLAFLVHFLLKRQKINQKKREAQHILQNAYDSEEQKKEQVAHEIEEYKLQVAQKKEQEKEALSSARRVLQKEIELMRQKTDDSLSHLSQQKQLSLKELDVYLKASAQKEEHLSEKQQILKESKKSFIADLQKDFSFNLKDMQAKVTKDLMDRAKDRHLKFLQEKEEHLKHNTLKRAQFILELALCRFQRPYCPERGIDNVVWTTVHKMEMALGPKRANLAIVEKECGVDVKVSDQEPLLSVQGLDPVRRELGRAVLNRLKNRKQVIKGPSAIQKLVQETKRDLFRKIKQDGHRICRDLNLTNIKPAIQNMMGALRYRYSFAQNQHFHCLEVGWLCGLLSAEIGEPVLIARRAGMLHDIGKAMDHSKEGGHAIIGAEFIQKHGESVPVVQAVKAHHHDVLPENPLDFLVISADALSGARPGARRSNVDSYNQRMLTLEKISRSFQGIKDTYIMSAGREIRVIVDSKKVHDLHALRLSQQIASKIEEECAYPGLIKVTVLRKVTKTVPILPTKHRGYRRRGAMARRG